MYLGIGLMASASGFEVHDIVSIWVYCIALHVVHYRMQDSHVWISGVRISSSVLRNMLNRCLSSSLTLNPGSKVLLEVPILRLFFLLDSVHKESITII